MQGSLIGVYKTMDVQADQKPIYDERANAILRGLVEGKTRNELAKELGYKNYKTLDIYMRRKNFKWDRDKQNYVPAYSRVDKQDMDLALLRSSKVATVISLFQKEGADAKTIAKRLGFADHRELANYMRAKGYRWSSEQGNYTRVYGQLQEEAEGRPEAVEELQDSHGGDEAVNTSTAPRLSRADTVQLERYLPLLEMLERNKDRLRSI